MSIPRSLRLFAGQTAVSFVKRSTSAFETFPEGPLRRPESFISRTAALQAALRGESLSLFVALGNPAAPQETVMVPLIWVVWPGAPEARTKFGTQQVPLTCCVPTVPLSVGWNMPGDV